MQQIFKFLDAGALVDNWAEHNRVFLFDFDELMYSQCTELVIHSTLNEAKIQNYKIIAVVESHPFFKEPTGRDERYKNKNQLLVDILKKYKFPFMMLTANWVNWQKPLMPESFFPCWFFRLRNFAIKYNYQDYKFPIDRKYNFSCCNYSNLRSEKILNYIYCFKKYRRDWYLTIYDRPDRSISALDITQVPNLTSNNRDIWNKEILPNLKPYEYDLLNGEQLNAYSTIFAGHTDAYCNIVVEHSAEIEIVSEKSFKPFIAEQVPVYVGQQGITKFIESLGFDVFRDFIDYTKYDALDSFVDRIEAMHQEIDNLYNNGDPGNFFKQPTVQSRLKKNKELFYSDHIDLLTIYYLDKLKSTVLIN